MIDRTQLTEALKMRLALDEPLEALDVIEQAARLLLDFPTDQQVEAAAKAMWEADDAYAELWGEYKDANDWYRKQAQAGLEAVRQTMIGDTDG